MTRRQACALIAAAAGEHYRPIEASAAVTLGSNIPAQPEARESQPILLPARHLPLEAENAGERPTAYGMSIHGVRTVSYCVITAALRDAEPTGHCGCTNPRPISLPSSEPGLLHPGMMASARYPTSEARRSGDLGYMVPFPPSYPCATVSEAEKRVQAEAEFEGKDPLVLAVSSSRPSLPSVLLSLV